jgi:hypothetical protein
LIPGTQYEKEKPKEKGEVGWRPEVIEIAPPPVSRESKKALVSLHQKSL